MRIFLLLLLLLLPFPADAQEIKCKHFFMGEPSPADWIPREVVIRDCYALLPDPATKIAFWVAYRLTPRETIGTLDLNRKWRTDPWLPDDVTLEARPDDYRGASALLKYDRGHLAPLGSFKGSVHASQVNYYSNITPQRAALNQGPWRHLEAAVRDLVWQTGEVFVLTGPLYEKEMPGLPNADEDHRVPSGFWKIVVSPTGENWDFNGDDETYSNGPQIVGFIMSQTPGPYDSIRDFIVTVQEIETRANIRVFPEMRKHEAVRIKGSVPWYWIDETFLGEVDYGPRSR